MIDFINSWLEPQSTVDKIYQQLLEIYQPLIFFINGMLLDSDLLIWTPYLRTFPFHRKDTNQLIYYMEGAYMKYAHYWGAGRHCLIAYNYVL